jgi:DNA-binding GntR family transcriptional regulator
VKFQRQPLRQAIQKEILTRIVTGSLPAGQRINETHLADDLGLSRTPLREAMLSMAAAGHLQADMGKGFLVPALVQGEMEELTEILALLQPQALGHAMPLEPANLVELSNHLNRTRMSLQRQGEGPAAGQALATLVISWNASLLGNGDGGHLAGDIHRLENLAARYWYQAGVKGMPQGELLASLQGLYEVIREGQKDRACQVWGDHIAHFGTEAAVRAVS